MVVDTGEVKNIMGIDSAIWPNLYIQLLLNLDCDEKLGQDISYQGRLRMGEGRREKIHVKFYKKLRENLIPSIVILERASMKLTLLYGRRRAQFRIVSEVKLPIVVFLSYMVVHKNLEKTFFGYISG